MCSASLVRHEAAGYAAFTLVQCLIETLIDKRVLTKDDADGICFQAAALNDQVSLETTTDINKDTANVIRALRESLAIRE